MICRDIYPKLVPIYDRHGRKLLEFKEGKKIFRDVRVFFYCHWLLMQSIHMHISS